MKKLITLFLLAISACTTQQVRPEGQEQALFPDGRYQQEVTVDVAAAKPPQNFDFDCFVQKSPEEMLFVGYNNFGISLFKIREKTGQPIEAESSVPQINEHKDFFIKIFKLVKTVVALRKNDPRLKEKSIHLEVEKVPAEVTFANYDALGIPLHMTVESPGQYQVKIKTTTYKLK